MKNFAFSLGLALAFFYSPLFSQTVWHVDTASVGSPDGLSWATALNDLKAALDSASSGDTIYVSEGIYLPDRGTGSRDSSFVMRVGVKIFGGFSVANNDTLFADRDWDAYPTILSGEIQDDGDSTNNTYRIISNNANLLTNAAVLDGFIVTGAFNSNTNFSNLTEGAGMFNITVSPTIRNCTFSNNTIFASIGTASGGAIFNFQSSPVITNCTFTNNKVYSNTDLIFANADNALGAAIYNSNNSSPTITNCSFTGNYAEGTNLARGGGIYNQSTSTSTLRRCVFSNNSCISLKAGSLANGAGVYNQSSSRSPMTNCVFYNNSITTSITPGSIAYGAALCNFNSLAYTIANCTFSGNSSAGADAKGGGMWNLTSVNQAPTIVNTVIFGNTAPTGGANLFNNNANTVPKVNNSDIGGCGGSSAWVAACGTDNGGNIDADPIFMDPSSDDYRLDTCSPAVNTGRLSSIPSGTTTDLDGNARVQADSVDMGAYEQSPSGSCIYTWNGSTDTDWGTASNWDRSEVPPDFASIVIPDVANDPVLDQQRSIGSITIDTSAELTLHRNKLQIYGDLTNDGTIHNDSSCISFKGQGAQSIAGNLLIDTLIAEGNGGVTVASGSVSINVELRLLDGDFNTGGLLTLISDTDHTARISSIASGASISGNITAQQFVSGSNTNWRLLTSVVQGQTLADWDDDMITTGFTGSDYPSFGWINIYTYDESVTGSLNNGYVGASSTSNSIGVAEGFMVYMGGTGDTIVDVTGPVYSGSMLVTLDFTSTPSAADDGWNLIGNPMPSPIDFGSLNVFDADNSYYVYDPATGNYASWDEDISTGTLGADGNIAQGQGFWMQATGAAASITLTEAAKTESAASFFSKIAKPYLTISLTKGGKHYDETIIRREAQAQNTFGLNDTRKLYNAEITLPAVSTVTTDSQELAINSIPADPENAIIPLVLHGDSAAIIQLDFRGTAYFTSDHCVVLEDLKNNVIYDLSHDTSYAFSLPENGRNEFLRIRMTAPPSIEMLVDGSSVETAGEVFVCEDQELILTATGFGNSVFAWDQGIMNGQPFSQDPGSKHYQVTESNAESGCTMMNDITISVEEIPQPEIERSGNILHTGKFASYQWYYNDIIIDGANEQGLEYTVPGTYKVAAYSEHACKGVSAPYELATGNIENNGRSMIRIFPNPGNDVMNINYGSISGDINITVTDVLGKIIFRETILNNTSPINRKYDLSGNPAGMYFVSIETEEGKTITKWVKK